MSNSCKEAAKDLIRCVRRTECFSNRTSKSAETDFHGRADAFVKCVSDQDQSTSVAHNECNVEYSFFVRCKRGQVRQKLRKL